MEAENILSKVLMDVRRDRQKTDRGQIKFQTEDKNFRCTKDRRGQEDYIEKERDGGQMKFKQERARNKTGKRGEDKKD